MKIKRGKKKSLVQQSKYVLGILMMMMLVIMSGCIYVLKETSRQIYEQMDQMSDLYTEELDNRFLRISRKLFSTIMDTNEKNSMFWKNVEYLQDGVYSEYAIGKLREQYLSSAWEYGTDYRILLYDKKNDDMYQLSISSEGNYTIDQKLQKMFREQVFSLNQKTYAVKKKWDVIWCEDETYICKIAQKKDIALGCVVNVKSILEPFSELSMGENGYVSLVDKDGNSIGILNQQGIVLDVEWQETSNYTIREVLSQAPFEIEIGISWSGVVSLMAGSLIGLSVVVVLLLFASVILLFHLYANIMQPLRSFTNNLQKYDEGDYILNMTEGKLIELEQIDGKFRNMIHQIRKLKITLYERELEKQKIEMDYLRMQIRPHFYLNCLNFIYSMIDFGEYGHARDMTRITSDYLSYIFRNTADMVPVEAETNHCENYLKILLLRYPNQFEYYFEVHEEVQGARIFPFLIQVFVENAAKHALTLEKKILISVTVYPEEREGKPYVNIFISDTGTGFPKEVLEKLQKGGRVSEKGKHIGIENCLKRFHYYYGESGEIRFENSPLGGAVVDIHIPYCMKGSE